VLGHVADGWLAPRVLLGVLGVLLSGSCIALALMPRSAGIAVIAVTVLACGVTATGWNGVFFAELLRNVPRERMAASAGGTQFFTFAGGTAGPVQFAEREQELGAYAPGYLCLAAVSAAAAFAMLWPSGQVTPERMAQR
jgi:ABC-type transport system involved in cytochrome c biogenesis permease subunit